jgi:hypothetical protein
VREKQIITAKMRATTQESMRCRGQGCNHALRFSIGFLGGRRVLAVD